MTSTTTTSTSITTWWNSTTKDDLPDNLFECPDRKTEMRYPGAQLSIVIIYLFSASVNVILFAIVIGVSIKDLVGSKERRAGWRARFTLYQMQVCLCLCLYGVSTSLGFLLFPCQPLDASGNADAFDVVCYSLAASMLFCILSAYSWVLVVSLHIIRLAAKQCKDEMNRDDLSSSAQAQGQGRQGRRMTLDDKMETEEHQAVQKQAVRKKFSQDLLELYREDKRRPIHGREMEEAEREERKRARSLWYLQVFSTLRLPHWLSFGFGYAFPLLLTVLSLLTRPETHVPQGAFDPSSGEDWGKVEGIDVFCWPGSHTKMIWYQVSYIPVTLFGAIYLRMKSVQMVRMTNAGNMTSGVSVQSVARWQKKQYRLQDPSELEYNYLMPTFLQMWVLTFNTFLGFLMSVSFWGAAIPFSTISVLKALVFFFHLFVVKTEFYQQQKWKDAFESLRRKMKRKKSQQEGEREDED